MTYDLVIIGGGPAGVAAGVYAARKKLRTVLITKDFMSQSTVSEGIENWIGTTKISGMDLAKNLEAHLRAYADGVVDIEVGQAVKLVTALPSGGYAVETESGKRFEAKAVLAAAGSHRRKLDIPGADTYEHKGITYCASCDGLLFSGKDVAVIGGGNSAFETAAQLAAYCASVTILQRGEEFRADPVTVERVLAMPNVKGVTGTKLLEAKGEKFLSLLAYEKDGKRVELSVAGVFVEIGSIPTTFFLNGLVDMDPTGHVKIDHRNQRTSRPGIWAAGDCTDGLYHQNNIAAGDAVKALEDIYLSLKAR